MYKTKLIRSDFLFWILIRLNYDFKYIAKLKSYEEHMSDLNGYSSDDLEDMENILKMNNLLEDYLR